MTTRVLVLDGRAFRPVEATTFLHDGWIKAQLWDAEFHRLSGSARDAVSAIYATGKGAHILAGLLAEIDVPWSPEAAEANAAFFAGRTDAGEKAQMFDYLDDLLADFFAAAPPSSTPSATASRRAAGAAARQGSAPEPSPSASRRSFSRIKRSSARQPSGPASPAQTSPSASGPILSSPSPSTATSGPAPSPTGT